MFAMPAHFSSVARAKDYALTPVPLSDVTVNKGFWHARLETNREVTIGYDFRQCELTGRIDNFAKAAGLMEGGFRGFFWDDSDVFKVIEGAAYSLATHPDAKLEAYLDALIANIAAAQEPDGYLYTHRTLQGANSHPSAGKTRWSRLQSSHELYNLGHLYEAAVAYQQATGKRSLLNVATKSAALLCRTFGPENIRDVPGHEEIEIGLVKLYRLTGETRYLALAKFFLDERGHGNGRNIHGPGIQDHKPVVDQDEAVGHAVRGAYLYAAMTDIAALTDSPEYTAAVDKLWQNVVGSKMYLTGGIGAQRTGEKFGQNYVLPNRKAYNETCAAIANALWNHRMFLLHADAKYVDVLERVIYNGFLSGVALSGDRFFYPNPLMHDGRSPFNHGSTGRSPWFGTSCCPVNVVRFLPSIAGYIYAQQSDAVYVNLFVASETHVKPLGHTVGLTQTTNYPWDGRVRIDVTPEQPTEFALHVRIPGWARNQPVPSDLYRFLQRLETPPTLTVNGAPIPLKIEKGFAVIRRNWVKGDTVQLELPMPIRRVVSHSLIKANADRVALQRGPLVYCIEAIDNNGLALNLSLQNTSKLTPKNRPKLLGGVTVIQGRGLAQVRDDTGEVVTTDVQITAVPYYAWANREIGEMTVWIPRDPSRATVRPMPTIASHSVPSVSHVFAKDTPTALNDQLEPTSSYDTSIPRFTWWDHRGTDEWVQYDFRQATRLDGVAVYWFDDTGHGSCRVPKSWRLVYRDGEQWRAVPSVKSYPVTRDGLNRIVFETIETTALRIEVVLQPGFSAGILEWKVLPTAASSKSRNPTDASS